MDTGNLQRVVVTGGAGFVGSHLVDALMKRGKYYVRVVDNLSSGNLENVRRWFGDKRFEFLDGDLKDPELASECVEGNEIVFHLAANPDVRLGEVDPAVHFNENLLATFNILEAMKKSETAKQIVFASTSTIYGEARVFPTPEDYGPLFPISVYGAAKLGCEALIASYCHTFVLEGVALRFANIVGSRSKHGVVVDFIRKLKENPTELEILGDGTQSKSYLHVKDLVKAFFVVLNDLKDNSPAVFNVGSLDKVDVMRICEIVCEQMGIQLPKLRFDRRVSDGRGWKGDVKYMHLSIEKLSSLGWKPSLNSENAIRLSCRELMDKN